MPSFDEYGDLMETGFESKEPVAPEDEMFHSVYIAGQMRKNHVGVMEKAGYLQVRGVEYNKEKVCMIITHTKQVLCNATVDAKQKETIHCFSFQEGEPPWKGTSGRECGTTAVERAANPDCADCRAQLLVAGILCKEDGKPILGEDGKPKFGFIRGKGTKYSNVSNYLNDRSKEDLEPIFTPVSDESAQFEKTVVNNKRFVTEITVTTTKSNFGDKMVFELTKGISLPTKVVLDVLKIAKETIKDFNKKFNWSKVKSNTKTVDDSMRIPETETSSKKEKTKTTKKSEDNGDVVSFDEVAF